MNKKALILSIPVILLVALFGGWLVFRGQQSVQNVPKQPIVSENPAQPGEIQAPDTVDTSSWKTYRNEAYGFEVKYPEGWNMDVFFSGGGSDPGVVCKSLSNECHYSVGFHDTSKRSYIAVQVIPKESPQGKDASVNEKSSQVGTTLSGLKYSVENVYDAMLSSCISSAHLTSSKNQDIFSVSTTHDDQARKTSDDAEKFCAQEYKDPIFNKIVGSFRLFDATDVDTSSWKTYRNEKYGFEFKYPGTWEMRKGSDEGGIGTQFLFSERGKLYDYEGSKVDAIILSVNLKDNPKLVSTDKLLEIWRKEYHVQTREFIVDNHLIATYYTGFGEGVLIDSIPGKGYELSLSSLVAGEPGVRSVLVEMGKSIRFLGN